MQSSELQSSFLRSLALVAWNRRRTLAIVLVAASFIWDFISLSASIKWDASGVCRFLHDSSLPSYYKLTRQLWNVLDLLLKPPCLFIFLNLVLMTIVVKSGVLRAMAAEKAAPLIPNPLLLEGPLRDVEKQHFLVGDDDAGDRLDEQLVQIGDIKDNIDEEISKDELYRRAEAYILKVRTSWLLQNERIKCTVE